jgi:hypothetical protein
MQHNGTTSVAQMWQSALRAYLGGLQKPDGLVQLVVWSCNSPPGVLGSIPKRGDPGKRDSSCVQVPG